MTIHQILWNGRGTPESILWIQLGVPKSIRRSHRREIRIATANPRALRIQSDPRASLVRLVGASETT